MAPLGWLADWAAKLLRQSPAGSLSETTVEMNVAVGPHWANQSVHQPSVLPVNSSISSIARCGIRL